MLLRQKSEVQQIQTFRATGTVLARDVLQLFEGGGATIDVDARLQFVIDSDFDGYLVELIKGLKKRVAISGCSNLKIAVVMPDGVIPEAKLAGLSDKQGVIRAFSAIQSSAATDWLGS